MAHVLPSRLRRFLTGENGSMVVPFALWLPVFIMVIVSSIELGTLTVRHTQLERALDQTVREVKIGSGAATHDEMKAAICARTTTLPGCTEMLHLEMVVLDMRDWSQPPASADCVDISEDVTPQRMFQNGQGGQMMLLRACYKFRPATPIGSFNASLRDDGQGYSAIVSTSAFVHEPS
jgi:hypothetical protein